MTGKDKKEKPHYLKRKFNSIVGENRNNDAISFIIAAIFFALIANFIEDPMARKRLSP